jgi:hypothetical protein
MKFIDEICAQPEEHVLAVVDDLSSSRMLVGRGPATKERTLLEEGDTESRFG